MTNHEKKQTAILSGLHFDEATKGFVNARLSVFAGTAESGHGELIMQVSQRLLETERKLTLFICADVDKDGYYLIEQAPDREPEAISRLNRSFATLADLTTALEEVVLPLVTNKVGLIVFDQRQFWRHAEEISEQDWSELHRKTRILADLVSCPVFVIYELGDGAATAPLS